MPDITWKAKLIDNDLEKEFKKEIRKKLKEYWDTQTDSIKQYAGRVFFEEIKNHRTYEALESGLLGGELGVTNEKLHTFMDDVQTIIEEKMECRYIGGSGSNDLGGIALVFESVEDNIAFSDNADFTSEGGYFIPWFNWLLKYGTQDIVFKHRFLMRKDHGRTGFGIMIKSESRNFAVDPEYAGTSGNNWFIQAANNARPKIIEFMIQKLRSI